MSIQKIDETIYRIAVPVPFPMKYVYCYVIKEKNGWTIIDTGLNYKEATDVWESVFTSLEIDNDSVNRIIVTHFHPDHFGLSGWLQQRTGAPVLMSKTDLDKIEHTWGEQVQHAEDIKKMFGEHGVSGELAEDIAESLRRLRSNVLPLPVHLQPLPENEIQIGEDTWKIIPVPGHCDGLISLYEPKRKYLIVADHVLNKITPNISLWPGFDPNPLGSYFQSLRKVQKLPVNLTLPAHGDLIENLSERVDEIIKHHDERLALMESYAGNGSTAYSVAYDVFSEKNLNPHQWRFAIAETLAHLEYSVSVERLAKKKEGSNYIYSQT